MNRFIQRDKRPLKKRLEEMNPVNLVIYLVLLGVSAFMMMHYTLHQGIDLSSILLDFNSVGGAVIETRIALSAFIAYVVFCIYVISIKRNRA